MSKPFYITTTLPYVNAEPHIGFALEIIQADILARYRRLKGDNVFFNTGTDEHGQKIFEAANKSGQNVKDYVDHYACEFQKLKSLLNISNDTFVRTTDPGHEEAARVLWQRCKDNNDIELREYSGRYCVGCEAYKSERDLDKNGKCLLHPNLELTTLHEKNYFFKFSKYQDKLLEYLSQPASVVPEWKRQEAINFVKDGLEDFSISRQRGQLEWGIPVPGDDEQVMYVWFDALTNYISTLGWPDEEGNFKNFWTGGETLQCAGKDQVRFQSLMWQAMLMSAKIKNTGTVFYHGFVNSNGQKMSKSLGNVVNPKEIIDQYGVDAFRYFVARELPTFEDGDFTWERFKETYNANLANGLGNLVSRIMKMAQDYLSEPVFIDFHTDSNEFNSYLDNYDINRATDLIWIEIKKLDGQIQTEQPFKLIKTDPVAGQELIKIIVGKLHLISKDLEPIMPDTAFKIQELIKANKMPAEPLFLRKD